MWLRLWVWLWRRLWLWLPTKQKPPAYPLNKPSALQTPETQRQDSHAHPDGSDPMQGCPACPKATARHVDPGRRFTIDSAQFGVVWMLFADSQAMRCARGWSMCMIGWPTTDAVTTADGQPTGVDGGRWTMLKGCPSYPPLSPQAARHRVFLHTPPSILQQRGWRPG